MMLQEWGRQGNGMHSNAKSEESYLGIKKNTKMEDRDGGAKYKNKVN